MWPRLQRYVKTALSLMGTSKTVSPHGQTCRSTANETDLDIIMRSCGFEALTYTPDQDKAADNIRVEATRPTAMGAKQDPINAGAVLESGGNWVVIFTSLLGIAMAV
jgi:hypothetical protein